MPACSATATVLLTLLGALASPAQGNEADQRRLCETWAAAYSYPSGIEQERCRNAFPELALDYGSYCARLRASGQGDDLSLAACRTYAGRRGEPT